jgi:iron complex outermembrane receptor protein
MRDVPSRTAAAGADRGLWLRGGAVTFLVGAAFGFDSPAARAQESPTPSATSQPAAAPATAPPAETPPASRSDNQYEEIVVTARKRRESIQEIPASVDVISDSVIKEAHITRLDDIGSRVSNLNIFEAHDNSPAVVMRGVGSFELVQGVGFYMNDVQLFEGQTVRPVDIARIEVLKGPQGTLYGGANIGGAIKYVTKDPTSTWQNEVTGEVGSRSMFNGAAVVSGPIADKLGMRLSVFNDNQNGYIWDTYNNETIGASHDRGGRLVFLAEPQDATEVRLSFNADSYNSQNENLQYKINQFPASLLPYTADTYRYSVDDFFIPSFIRKLYATTLQVDHQFGNGITFNSITSQFWSLNRGITDFTKKPFPLDLLFQNQDQRVLSQEFRLASTGHSNLDWLAGAFVQRHTIDITNSDLNYNGNIPATPTTCCGSGTDGTLPFDYDIQNKVQKQYAVFGDATYYLGNWQFELGLRGEHYTSNLKAKNQPSAATPAGMAPSLLVLGPQDLNGDQLSPRASIQYKLLPGTNIYGTFARGFQPGDLSEQNGAITTIRPETAISYELGVKSRLPYGAQLNAAVFLVDYKDRWYQNLVAVAGQFQDIVTNVGPSRNTGIEVEFLVPLGSEFKLNGGFGTTRARWRSAQYFDPQLTAAAAIAGNPHNVFRDLDGLTAPFTPAYSVNLGLDWNRILSNGYKVGARLDGSAIGQSYWNPNDIARQKAYQLMNAGAHLDAGNWTWIAHVSNLTGTRFNTMYFDATDVGVPDNHSFARINRPRTVVLSGTYRF